MSITKVLSFLSFRPFPQQLQGVMQLINTSCVIVLPFASIWLV